MLLCVCVCQTLSLRALHLGISRGAVDHYHSLPNEDSDRSVVKQCGTPHCVPAEFSPSCDSTFHVLVHGPS